MTIDSQTSATPSESLVDPARTHRDRSHPYVRETHRPLVCDTRSDCSARDWCGHAKVHVTELMYDNCSGHVCQFKGQMVHCISPDDKELEDFIKNFKSTVDN